MDDTVIWVGGVVAVMVVTGASLSVVPRGQRRVVTRGGQVCRVAESGLVWRIPVLERFEPVLSGVHDHPVAVRAMTIDGVPLLVLLEIMMQVRAPDVGRELADPWLHAEEAVEREVVALVHRLQATRLQEALRAAESQLLVTIREALRPLGVELHSIEVVEVGLPVRSDGGPES